MYFRKKENGSIVLEASLILPFFMCFILALITMIRIASVEIALQHTVSEATKQISTHMYPIGLLYDRLSETNIGTQVKQKVEEYQGYREQILTAENVANDISRFLPTELSSMLRKLTELRQGFEQGVIGGYNSSLNTIFQPMVDHYADDRILEVEQLHVTKVTLPNLQDRKEAYFGLEVRYDLPLHLPFIDKTLSFKHQAYERVWAGNATTSTPKTPTTPNTGNSPGNSNPSNGEEGDGTEESEREQEEEKREPLVIDSITSPVQRGRHVTIFLQGPSNSTATVRLEYQSGFFKEFTCRSNDSGWYRCSAPIGGNSNEGEYKAIITVSDQQVSGNFQVFSKENMKKKYK